MTILQFRDEVIRRGIESAVNTEKGYKLTGALRGFEIAETLETPQGFELALQHRHIKESQIRQTDIDREIYWEYHYATLQIEFVWERMRIAWHIPGAYSAQALLQCNEIIMAFEKQ